ncbi:MAG TPA: hypothetical protein VFI31_00110 [Pirellulales bacterium]|nr:hypothetical protein [Pirellulales bacterium]
MARPRFQFKLRTLLIALSLMCSTLGLFHLFWQPQIATEPRGADRLTVRWRLLRFGGEDFVPCEVLVVGGQRGGEVVYKQSVGAATNRGWARYFGKLDLSLRVPPGNYNVVLNSETSTLQTTFTVQ